MPELSNSARRVQKVTYAQFQLQLDAPDSTATEGVAAIEGDSPGTTISRALVKYSFARNLSLQEGEVSAVRDAAGTPTSLAERLALFENRETTQRQVPLDSLASTDMDDLISFGKALTLHREKRLKQIVAAANRDAETTEAAPSNRQGTATYLTNAALQATAWLTMNQSTTPIGLLNLERLEMYPAGVERGELLATVPLAPLEQTAVVQKEWSSTTSEFTSIVTDQLENYSETGVTENSELAQSTTSQNQHSNQSNVNATVSGGVSFATVSTSLSASTGLSSSKSMSDSAKHAVATTKKASARVKQEHKVTISTTTVTGSSETSTRTFQNPNANNAIRIDFFGLMRKWHVGLYRYGARLTYDIVIPEPGGAMREAYKQLADLQSQATTGFTFPLNPVDINETNWQTYQQQFQAALLPPPEKTIQKSYLSQYQNDGSGDWYPNQVDLEIPDGYAISSASFAAVMNVQPVQGQAHTALGSLRVMHVDSALYKAVGDVEVDVPLDFLQERTGTQHVVYATYASPSGTIEVLCTIDSIDQTGAIAKWQAESWTVLYNSAQTQFYAQQNVVQGQIKDLTDRLNGVDTLTLRREEHDEIMRGVLAWLLGPQFEFMPLDIRQLFRSGSGSTWDRTAWGINFAGNILLDPQVLNQTGNWSLIEQYEQMIRFINDAIDWDNLLYFLYSYFWDIPDAWDNIREIQHPDATRQAFLRAGSARVVLTVRKDWETAWVNFVEGGVFTGGSLPELHPYLTIAREIQDFDNTNYPGIPPADPGRAPDSGAYIATDCLADLDPAAIPAGGRVVLTVRSSSGFIEGYSVVLDTWDATKYDPATGRQAPQETRIIIGVPDATHIEVDRIENYHKSPFRVIQAGEKGQLIAEWYEYTPSSGTDIEVTSNLTTIA
ncbi:hypothetical protein ACIRRA_42825 [Nocardia sp. NPDC101769]|uniref:hypothetical protein n=1 Tax=Nocardia sp. NPDC101769 TaxID=3364333 RepID=UPI0038160264